MSVHACVCIPGVQQIDLCVCMLRGGHGCEWALWLCWCCVLL